MSFLNHLKYKADTAKLKASNLVRINNIRGEINALNQNLLQVRVQIANTVVDLYNSGKISNEEIDEFCKRFNGIKSQIQEKESLITSIREEEILPPETKDFMYAPSNPCPQCNADVPLQAKFCTNCGAPMPEREAVNEQSDVQFRLCSKCGYRIPEGGSFCPKCGTQLEKPDIQLEKVDESDDESGGES